jgi:hypothetical protein
MEFDPFNTHYHRRQIKRQQFKPVLRELMEGLASLVQGQRCFADEFGLSYGRVFHDDFESFKGKNIGKEISQWLREGEEGAAMLRKLFDDLAQHQVALVEAADEVARESLGIAKISRSNLVKKISAKSKVDLLKSKEGIHTALHQNLIITAFVIGYAKSRERMRNDQTESSLVSRLEPS